ncbi:MAG: tetratricopeptide repeat protein [Bdellovibrio sp.]
MQEFNSGLQSNRFNLRETPEAVQSTKCQEKFLIRPENPTERAKAIFAFDQEHQRQKSALQARTASVARPPVAAKDNGGRPDLATLLVNAEVLLRNNEKSAAAHLIRQALFLDSRNPEAIRKMIRCLGNQEWEVSQCKALHEALVDIEPSFQNFCDYGKILVDSGDLDGALEAFFEANMRVSDEGESLFEVFKQMGNIYVRKADFESAEEFYHKAFTLNPDSDVLQVNLGTLSVQQQDWGRAMERFRNALEINPLNDKAWVGLGLCYQQVGDSHLAQATLENALDIAPANRTAVHLMASWSFNHGSVSGAVSRMQDYLATQESDVEMSLVLIHLFCQERKYSMAEIELERALCWAPGREDLVELKTRIHELQEQN